MDRKLFEKSSQADRISSARSSNQSRTAPITRLNGSVTRSTISRYVSRSESFNASQARAISSLSPENKDLRRSNDRLYGSNTYVSIQPQISNSASYKVLKARPIACESSVKNSSTSRIFCCTQSRALSRISTAFSVSRSFISDQAVLISDPFSENQSPSSPTLS